MVEIVEMEKTRLEVSNRGTDHNTGVRLLTVRHGRHRRCVNRL